MSFLQVTPPGLHPPPTPAPKPKMGKKKSDIYSCFQILPVKNKANKSIFMCKFCDRQYLQNATKMESHIVTQCQKVPPEVRTSYAKVPGGGPRPGIAHTANNHNHNSNNNNSTRTSSPASDTSGADSRPQTPVNLSQLSAANRARMTSGVNLSNTGGARGQLNNNSNSCNNIVIKRAGGTLISTHVPRVSPRDSLLLLGNHSSSKSLINNGGGGGQQKRPRLAVDHHHNNQLNNHYSNNVKNHNNNNNNNYMQRQLLNNSKSIGSLGKQHLNSLSNSNNNTTARSKVTAIANHVNINTASAIMDHKEMVDIWKLLAKGIYATGCPVSVLENEYWVEAFKKIRPVLTLPTTYALSNTLLREEYQKIRQDIHNLISQANFVTLQCESHPGNSPEEKILSFFVTTPSPILYQTVTITQSEISTKEKLTAAISSTIEDIGSAKVVAFISDLTPNLQSSWELLRSKFPGLLTFGCILQGLNTLLDSFLETLTIQEMCQKGKTIVDKTKSSPALKKRFQEIQRQLKLSPVKGFKFSSKSKWSSLAKSLTLLTSQKEAFKELVNCEEARSVFDCKEKDSSFSSFEDLVEITQDEDFWTGIDGVTNIIVPLSNWIKIMELESSPSISRLPQIFHELKSAYEKNLSNLPLKIVPLELQQSFLKQLIQTKRFCMNELHYAAGLLNPKLKSLGVLTEDEEEEGSEFIHYFCETRDLDAQTSLKELLEYRKSLGIFGKQNVWKLADSLDPVAWWNSVRPGSALAAVAVHLLTISPPLSTFDPNTLFGTVPCNQGDLEKDKVDKLAFVQHHLQRIKKSSTVVVDSLLIPKAQPTSNTKEWSPPQVEFKLEDQEPIDVTQFLSQNPTSAGIYTDSEEEADTVDTDTKNNNINSIAHSIISDNPNKNNSILSNLMRGLPNEVNLSEPEDEEMDTEDSLKNPTETTIVVTENKNSNINNNNNYENDNDKEDEDDDDSSSDSDGSSSGSSSSADEDDEEPTIKAEMHP